jgi:predicted GH43/DUF377 family glycosyl hydrolase
MNRRFIMIEITVTEFARNLRSMEYLIPPIKTEEGWLEIYHGVKITSTGPIYRIGTVMLDLENPAKVISRCEESILTPRESYERIGDVGNVVFACGAVLEDNDEIKVCYGGTDTYLYAAVTSFSKLINFILMGKQSLMLYPQTN